MSKSFAEKIADVKDADEIFEDPHKFGLPTFDEFARNRDKYLGREDDRFSEADAGSKALNKHVQRHVYEIEGYRCKTLEEVERVARNQGIPLKELDYQPQVVPTSAGKCDLLVRFVSKTKREARRDW